MEKVFVSYSWKQQNWLKRNLIPLLDACGYEVLVDYRHFEAGQHNIGQMDKYQDDSERQILLLSKTYLASDYCMHELRRAVQKWGLTSKKVVPVCYEADALPTEVTDSGTLYVGPLEGWDANHWGLFLRTFDLNLGMAPKDWLDTRMKVRNFLERGNSVNLVAKNGKPWRPLVNSLAQDKELELGVLDFEAGYARNMSYLVRRILRLAGMDRELYAEDSVLPELTENMETLDTPSRQVWLHFSHTIKESQRTKGEGMFDYHFFAAVRHLAQERKLNLLIHSRQPVASWLEKNHQLSHVDFKTVEL